MAKSFQKKKGKVKRTLPATGDALSLLENEKENEENNDDKKQESEQKEQGSSQSSDKPESENKQGDNKSSDQENKQESSQPPAEEPKTSSPAKSRGRKSKEQSIDENASTRHSFIMQESTLDKLKDFVYTKKVTGEFRYSQEQAIEDGMQLLFKTVKNIVERPEEERALERKRSQRIKDGRRK